MVRKSRAVLIPAFDHETTRAPRAAEPPPPAASAAEGNDTGGGGGVSRAAPRRSEATQQHHRCSGRAGRGRRSGRRPARRFPTRRAGLVAVRKCSLRAPSRLDLRPGRPNRRPGVDAISPRHLERRRYDEAATPTAWYLRSHCPRRSTPPPRSSRSASASSAPLRRHAWRCSAQSGHMPRTGTRRVTIGAADEPAAEHSACILGSPKCACSVVKTAGGEPMSGNHKPADRFTAARPRTARCEAPRRAGSSTIQAPSSSRRRRPLAALTFHRETGFTSFFPFHQAPRFAGLS